ncbi:hypothetical protein KC363_g128 [Hortaea werneckii]|nr:hypothetical protein KC363_g128 [Hortaea werneckii]
MKFITRANGRDRRGSLLINDTYCQDCAIAMPSLTASTAGEGVVYSRTVYGIPDHFASRKKTTKSPEHRSLMNTT